MLGAILEVAGSRQRPKETEIIFAALVDEESAQTGSRTLGASGFRADLAIVGEPTMARVVTAHKGVLAQSADPWEGSSWSQTRAREERDS